MTRLTRLVPATVLIVAALALAPAAQAKPFIAPSGSSGFVNPSVQSTQDFTTHNPNAAVTVAASTGSGFDWTAAALGAGLAGILILTIVAGVGYRRRGRLAL